MDGARSICPAENPGESVVGPLGLLALLELHLGCGAPNVTQAQRAVQYRRHLKQALADRPSCFFEASFTVDELGTAERLLRWRDQWYLEGWNGDAHPFFTGRMADLTAVEQLAKGQVSPGIGERLMRLEAELQTAQTPIEVLYCFDAPESLPLRWRAVLNVLPTEYLPPAPQAGAGTLLQGLQQRLLSSASEQSDAAPLGYVDDGSVRVVKAGSRLLSGAWLAHQLKSQASPYDTVLLVEDDAQLLDDLLSAQQQPALGFADASPMRPALQVLPLALTQLWQPVDIFGLVAFLTHGLCPIRGLARSRLATKIASQPGIDRDHLAKTFADIRKEADDQNLERPEQRIDVDAMVREAEFWLFSTRYRPEEGAPISDVVQRVNRISEFFRKRLGLKSEDSTIGLSEGAAFQQCMALLDGLGQLTAQGETVIQPRVLQKLVRQASSKGALPPGRIAQVGACRVADTPAQVIESADEVIWWGLEKMTLPAKDPYTLRERAELLKAGIELPRHADRIKRAQAEVLRPLLAARTRLTLVLPAHSEEAHPLLQWVQHAVTNLPVASLDDLLEGQAADAETSAFLLPVTHEPLPEPRRWWQLPPGIVPTSRKDKDSYSSIDLYLSAPQQWVLRYGAQIRPSQVLAIPSGPLLFGTLAHDVVEALLKSSPDALSWSPDEVSARALEALETLVETKGAILLMPGQGGEIGRLRVQVAKSAEVLWEAMRKAEVVEALPEKELDGSFADGAVRLHGYADLLLTRADGAQAVVDMKWGSANDRAKQLKGNRHLQLLLYAGMVADQEDGLWPEAAYFILSKQAMLAQHQGFFDAAEVHSPSTPDSPAEIRRQAVQTWQWRRDQLGAGRIEVIADATLSLEDDDSSAPEGAFEPDPPKTMYDDYRHLVGWEPNS